MSAGTPPSPAPRALGFPPGALTGQPLRLAVLAAGDDWLALEKPPGLGVREHPWDAGAPLIESALNRQLAAGKPELARLGVESFGSVFYLEPELAGVALFATTRTAGERFRNAYGSHRFGLEFELLARQADGAGQHRVDTPLLPHRSRPLMILSSAKGKKCATCFTRLSRSASGWELWRAETTLARPHQVRIHAASCGIPVAGDTLYGGPAVPRLRELRPQARGAGIDRPVYQGLALRLSQLRLPGSEAAAPVRGRVDGAWKNLLRKLALPPPAPGDD